MRISKITNNTPSFGRIHIKKDEATEHFFRNIRLYPVSTDLCLLALSKMDKETGDDDYYIEMFLERENEKDLAPDYNIIVRDKAGNLVNNKHIFYDSFWDGRYTVPAYKALLYSVNLDVTGDTEALDKVFETYA